MRPSKQRQNLHLWPSAISLWYLCNDAGALTDHSLTLHVSNKFEVRREKGRCVAKSLGDSRWTTASCNTTPSSTKPPGHSARNLWEFRKPSPGWLGRRISCRNGWRCDGGPPCSLFHLTTSTLRKRKIRFINMYAHFLSPINQLSFVASVLH